jgi:DNA-directed RNA polymerase delta subunit
MLHKFFEFNKNSETMTFVEAAKTILSESNKPLSVREIWGEISSRKMVSTGNWKNAINTLSTKLLYNSNIFEKIEGSPIRFKLKDINQIEEISDIEKVTFTKAAQVILQDNNNIPMSPSDIWNQISERELVETKGKNPTSILFKLMSINSDNSSVKDKKGTNVFTITQKNPIKFKLINPEEIQDVTEDEIQDVTEEEIESSLNIPAVRNPFGGESKESGDLFNSSALFVVGESGSGKSTRILKVLRQNGHKIILIGAESAPSPNLLFDYDQSEGYIPSDIGEFIISAKNNPKNFYTIVFDECHEYIDEIKRSILHAISTKRGEKRFFGVKKTARYFFDDLETYETTSKIIPDNVGFIFISSKPDVFEYHADFMGRVDKVEVKREDPYPYPDLKYIQSKIDREDQI